MVQNRLKYGMILITWRNARTGHLFVIDARNILQGVEKPDISHIEKNYNVHIPCGLTVKKANIKYIQFIGFEFL